MRSDGCFTYYPSGGFVAEGDEFLALIDKLRSRGAAWALSQGFERFESCLKDLLAAYYFANPGLADPKEVLKAEKDFAKGLDRGHFEFWNAFARRRSAADPLVVLRALAPQIEDAEHRNSYQVDLVKWFRVVSESRHAVIHSDLRIPRAKWERLGPDEQQLLKDSLAGTVSSHGYALRPTVDQARVGLARFTEYGYAAFKALSIKAGTEWRMFPEQGR